MLTKQRVKKPPMPVRPVEPGVHQWGYERVQSGIAPTLKPKPQDWKFGVAAVPPATGVAVGAELLQAATGAVAPTVLAAGVVCGGIVALGLRRKERAALSDRATEDIASLVSTYLTRKSLKVLRWSGGWLGYPAKIRITYDQGAAGNATLREELAELLSDRVGMTYELVKHDPRKRQLVYQVDPGAEEIAAEEDQDPLTERVTKIATKLFSAPSEDAPRIDLEWENEKLSKVHVQHNIGMNLTSALVRKDKAHKFSVQIPGRWKVDWNTEEDTATFTLRPDLPTFIAHPPISPMVGTPQENYKTPLRYGIDETGEHMAWRPWLDPMMLIVGRTGRGKTVVAHSILTELAARGWLVDVSDAKLIEFIGYKSWPNVRCVGAILEEQVRLVHAALELMQDRYAQIVNGEAEEDDFQPYCLFLDEYALFREDLADWYSEIKQQGEPAKVPTSRKVNAVLRAGRTARVHIVLLTQRPDAEVLGSGEPRLNLSCRVSMGPLDMDGARMMYNNPTAGVAVPTNIRGRGTTRNEAGDIVEFQAYWTPDPRKAKEPEDLAILDGLKPAQTLHPKMKIVLPTSTFGEPSKEGMSQELPPTYSEYANARMVPLDYEEPEDAESDQEERGRDTDLEADVEDTRISAEVTEAEPERSILRLVRAGDPEPSEAGPEKMPPTSRAKSGKGLASVSDLRIREKLEEEDSGEEESEDCFGEIETLRIEDIVPGTKVLIDEGEGIWGIVADSMADESEEAHWVIACVTDDGADETIVAPEGEIFPIRKQQ
jgi:DNA segregation ATPase FtsK/SpoIIIE, S-DNA-T family